jgi:hypothetical protein
MKTRYGVALALATILGLSGCGIASEIADVTDAVSGALDESTESSGDEAEGSDLGAVLSSSEGEDFLMEYILNEEQETLWFLQSNTPSGVMAISIIPDPSGMHSFTAARLGSDAVQSPFSELNAVTGYTPGLIVTPGPDGTSYTWTAPPTTWTIQADRAGKATYYRMDSPEGTFEMNFFYGSDITDRIPQAFIDDSATVLDASTQEFVYGTTSDDFATWEFFEF